MQSEIAELIDDEGRTVSIRKKTASSYDASTSTSTTTTTADEETKALILAYKDRDRDGTNIKMGDRKAVVKAKDIASPPDTDDFLVVDSKEYLIVNIQIIEEAETPIAYICQIRG